MRLVKITPRYKILECRYIVKNKEQYSKLAVEKAKQFLLENETKSELPIVTEEQRQEIKNKYPNTYRNE